MQFFLSRVQGLCVKEMVSRDEFVYGHEQQAYWVISHCLQIFLIHHSAATFWELISLFSGTAG
jgi:hypothetical protein